MTDYSKKQNIPEDLKQMIQMFLQAKECNDISADLYSDEIRSLAHHYSGYKISEEDAENIIKVYKM